MMNDLAAFSSQSVQRTSAPGVPVSHLPFSPALRAPFVGCLGDVLKYEVDVIAYAGK